MITQEDLDRQVFTKEQDHPLGSRRVNSFGQPEVYVKKVESEGKENE